MKKHFEIFAAFCLIAASLGANAQEKDFTVTFDLKGGPAYMIASPSESLSDFEQDHIKDLKSGNQFKVAAHYFVNKLIGFGFHYSRFGSNPKSQFNATDMNEDQILDSGTIENDYKVRLYAPSIQLFLPIANSDFHLKFDQAIGVLELDNKYFYTINNQASSEVYLLTGYTLGSYSSLGLSYKITKNISAGIDLSALSGSYGKLKNYDTKIELDERENVTRLNLEGGITVFL